MNKHRQKHGSIDYKCKCINKQIQVISYKLSVTADFASLKVSEHFCCLRLVLLFHAACFLKYTYFA